MPQFSRFQAVGLFLTSPYSRTLVRPRSQLTNAPGLQMTLLLNQALVYGLDQRLVLRAVY